MKTSLTSALGRLSIELPKTTTRSASSFTRYKRPRPDLTHFEPGHGEQIWVWKNIFSHQIIYSHKPVMDSNRALRQLPFNGKKSKPTKLRKDQWAPMALIQFAEGEGVIGQSVFQKLREFRMEHELSWGWQRPHLLRLEKKARLDKPRLGGISPLAKVLNNQHNNAIADMAAVLAGAGRGNRIWLNSAENKGGKVGNPAMGKEVLAETTLYWANIEDRKIAEAWSSNVNMVEGLPPLTKVKPEDSDRKQFEGMSRDSDEKHRLPFERSIDGKEKGKSLL